MAEDSTDYIHPIIQAMQFASQQADERKKAVLAQQNTQTDQQFREKELAQRLQEHSDEVGQKQQQLDMQHQLNKVQLQQHDLDIKKFIKDFIVGGGQPDSQPQTQGFIPTYTNLTPPSQLSVGGIPVTQQEVDAYSKLPEAEFNRQFGQFKQQKDYEEGLKESTNAQQAALERKTLQQKSQLDFANRMEELKQTGVNTLAVADRNHANELELEKMRIAGSLAVAHVAHQQDTADLAPTIQNAFEGVLNGQTDYSKLPKDIKNGVSKVAGQLGFELPTDRKAHADKIDAVTGIQTLVNQYQDLALHYSRDGDKAGVQNYLPGSLANNIPFTDLKSQVDALKTTGGTLASFFDKQNRKSDSEILRQVAGLFDPNDTKQQNLEKLEKHKALLNTAVKNTFAGMKPEEVRYILGSHGITDLSVGDSTPSKPDTVNLRQKYGY